MPQYDWDNQCTYALMERKTGLVKGGSEPQTLVVNLWDIPMSAQDFVNYVDCLESDAFTRRSPEHVKNMYVHLRDMGEALKSGDDVGYHSARQLFLNEDENYRNEQLHDQGSLLWYEEDTPNNPASEQSADLWCVSQPASGHDDSRQQCVVENASDNHANSSNEQATQGTAPDNSFLM